MDILTLAHHSMASFDGAGAEGAQPATPDEGDTDGTPRVASPTPSLLPHLFTRPDASGARAFALFSGQGTDYTTEPKIRRAVYYQVFCENIKRTTNYGSLCILQLIDVQIYSKCAQACCVPVFCRIPRAAAEMPHGCEITRPIEQPTHQNSRQMHVS